MGVDAPTRLRRVRPSYTPAISCLILSCNPPRLEQFFYGVHKVWMGDHWYVFHVNTRSSSLLIGELGQSQLGPLHDVSKDRLRLQSFCPMSLVLKLCQGSSSGCWGCDNLLEERFRKAMKKTLYIPVRFNQHKQHNQHNQNTCVYVGDNSTSKNIKDQSNSTPAAWLSPWQKRCGPGGAQESPRQRFLCRDSDPGVVLGMDGFSISFPNHWVYITNILIYCTFIPICIVWYLQRSYPNCHPF